MSFPSRDLRDPKALGAALLELRKLAAKWSGNQESLAWLYDRNLRGEGRIPDYDGSNDIKTATPSGAEH